MYSNILNAVPDLSTSIFRNQTFPHSKRVCSVSFSCEWLSLRVSELSFALCDLCSYRFCSRKRLLQSDAGNEGQQRLGPVQWNWAVQIERRDCLSWASYCGWRGYSVVWDWASITKEDIVYASLLLSLCLLCFRFVRLVRRVVVALLQQWFAQSLQHPSKSILHTLLIPLVEIIISSCRDFSS